MVSKRADELAAIAEFERANRINIINRKELPGYHDQQNKKRYDENKSRSKRANDSRWKKRKNPSQ